MAELLLSMWKVLDSSPIGRPAFSFLICYKLQAVVPSLTKGTQLKLRTKILSNKKLLLWGFASKHAMLSSNLASIIGFLCSVRRFLQFFLPQRLTGSQSFSRIYSPRSLLQPPTIFDVIQYTLVSFNDNYLFAFMIILQL